VHVWGVMLTSQSPFPLPPLPLQGFTQPIAGVRWSQNDPDRITLHLPPAAPSSVNPVVKMELTPWPADAGTASQGSEGKEGWWAAAGRWLCSARAPSPPLTRLSTALLDLPLLAARFLVHHRDGAGARRCAPDGHNRGGAQPAGEVAGSPDSVLPHPRGIRWASPTARVRSF
jgi:hypothetical protein